MKSGTIDFAELGVLLCDHTPKELACQVLQLREALEWYADRAVYQNGSSARPALIERDGGHRARIALAACDDGVSL